MRELTNWNELNENENGGSLKLAPGAYTCQVKKVVDHPDKEYLEIQFDIINNKIYNNYFKKLKDEFDIADWSNGGIYRASYKESASQLFRNVITAFQKSNIGFVWNWNEQSLVGKVFVGVFGEEEYEYNGEIRTAVKCRNIRSTEALAKGEIKPLAKKTLQSPIVDNSFKGNLPF